MTKGSRSKSPASMNSRGALPSQGLGFITDTYQMHVEQQERRIDKHKQSKQIQIFSNLCNDARVAFYLRE